VQRAIAQSKTSQVKLSTTNDMFCVEKRSATQSNSGIIRGNGLLKQSQNKSNQVINKLLITNDAFCVEKRAATHSQKQE
jgi:hypothetical protein